MAKATSPRWSAASDYTEGSSQKQNSRGFGIPHPEAALLGVLPGVLDQAVESAKFAEVTLIDDAIWACARTAFDLFRERMTRGIR